MTRAKNLLLVSGYGNRTAYLNLVAAGLEAAAPPPDLVPFAIPVAERALVSADTVGSRVESAIDGLRVRTAQTSPRSPQPKVVHLSFSHVDVFDTCPLKYKFTFVTPLPGLAHGVGGATVRDAGETARFTPSELGTVFHDALERWAREDRPLEELVTVAARDRGWPALHEADARQARRFVENFLASSLGRRKPAAEDVEVPFTLFIRDDELTVTVSGAIDRLDAVEDGWAITDYKTNRGVEPNKYGLQLSIYKLAVEQVLGRRVAEARAYFVRFPEGVGLVPVALLDAQTTRERVLNVARRIASRRYHLEEHPGSSVCWRCPFGGRDGGCPEKRTADSETSS